MSVKHKARLHPVAVVFIVLLAVIAGGGAYLWMRNPHTTVTHEVTITPSKPATTTPQPEASTTLHPTRSNPVRPTNLVFPHMGETYKVWQLPRVVLPGNQVTSPVPPNFDATSFAWDEASAVPGSKHGVAIFTSHTYADGSAMANQLLAELHEGDVVIVVGKKAKQAVAYRVTERLTVLVDGYPAERVLDMKGKPQLSITVCSGQRLGPENWTKRTIWFAEPVER